MCFIFIQHEYGTYEVGGLTTLKARTCMSRVPQMSDTGLMELDEIDGESMAVERGAWAGYGCGFVR